MVAGQAQALIAGLLLLVLGVLAAGCAPGCPVGARSDAGRVARLGAMLSEEPLTTDLAIQAARVCFAPGRGRGIITGLLIELDRDAADAELAGQLAHLLVYARDRLGDGCAAGLSAAERSEHDALALETRLRARLGLPAVVVAPAAIADYRRRCAPSR